MVDTPKEDRATSSRIDRRGFILGAGSFATLLAGCGGDGGETTASPTPTPTASPETAKENLQWWGEIEKADGEEGRPLPLTASWGSGGIWDTPWKTGDGYNEPHSWGPDYLTDLIEQGHHVFPTYKDPINTVSGDYTAWDAVDKDALDDENCSDALEYCAEHSLPIAFVGGNYATYPKQFETGTDRRYTTENTARYVKNGVIRGDASPIAPIKAWEEVGRAWWGQQRIHRMIHCHPDPPKIVCLDNGEAGELSAEDINTNADRFVEKFGEDTIANMSEERKEEIIREGYEERFQAMFAAAREALSEEWAEAINFVEYNGTGVQDVLGRQEKHNEWTMKRTHDGAMPECYDNEWEAQEGKSDHSPWSMQSDKSSLVAFQDHFFEEDPDYYYANIGWEGSEPDRTKPGHRGYGSKPNQYIVGDLGETSQEWDLDRYQGWIQFVMWLQRPRSFRQFRGGEAADAYHSKAFMRYVEMVDRVWARDDLNEFWKHGDLVPNAEEEHFMQNLPNAPDWVKELDRWFILTCDANPPRSEWEEISIPSDFPSEPYPSWEVDLRVFPMALQLGEEPERRWLVYAHAPLGAVADATIQLPGYGELTLDHVAKNGTFAIVDEAGDQVSVARQGGPAQINVDAASDVVGTGESVDVTAEVGCPPDSGFASFTWEYAGETAERDSLGTESLSFDEPGQQQIRVAGTTGGGDEVAATTTVYVGEEPADSLVYDLPLDKHSAYEGPWGAVGTEFPGELMTYRLAPNPGGAGPRAPVHGGEFVEDEKQGTVFELSEEWEGLWLVRSQLTSQHPRGHGSKTIKLRFKPEDVGPKQYLFREGEEKGFHIYLEGGTLHAGTWGKGGTNELQADVSAGQWHHVALVLDGAGRQVTDGAMSLYLDGEEVATGPGVRIPNHKLSPKVGWGGPRVGDEKAGRSGLYGYGFVGRIADFVQSNDARPPE